MTAIAVRNVAVIGAGIAGRAVALRCAGAGFDVVLEDVMPERLRRAQDEYAELAGAGGSVGLNSYGSPAVSSLNSAGSLRYATTVEDAVHAADIAIDFVPDELESKLEIFSLLDRMAPPRTILCTPTRALSITDLASCTYRPGRCVGLRGVSGDFSAGFADGSGGEVEILRSRFLEAGVAGVVGDFLSALGLVWRVVEDQEEPMLVKNLLPPR
jgi:3-hydroxybutyryl-CoA dehydrogenase